MNIFLKIIVILALLGLIGFLGLIAFLSIGCGGDEGLPLGIILILICIGIFVGIIKIIKS